MAPLAPKALPIMSSADIMGTVMAMLDGSSRQPLMTTCRRDPAESDDRMWMRMYVVAFGPRVGTSLSRFDSWRDRHALRSLMSGGGYGCVESEPGNRGALLRFAADCGDLRVAEIIETHLGP
jgi:hypothetical protein